MAGIPFNPMALEAPTPNTMPAPQASGGLARLREMKAKAPNGQGMTDAQFAVAAHQHYYSDIPMVDYLAKLGLDRGDVLYELRKPGDSYGDYLRQALSNPGSGESQPQADTRLGGSLEDRRPGGIEGALRAGLQGATFGFGDEIVGAGAATLDPLFHGNSGKDWGQRFNAYAGREQQSIDQFREDQPIAAYGAEIAGALPTAFAAPLNMLSKAPTVARVLGGVGASAAEGALYGFGSANGDMENRTAGALTGATLGTAGGIVAPMLVKGGQAALQRFLQGRATKAAVRGAPTTAALKAGAKASYDASRATGAILDQKALQILQHDMRQMLDGEGLLMPSSGVVGGEYPKVKAAMDALAEYTAGPMTIEQTQTLLRRFRKVAGSPDRQEARIGFMMIDQLDSFMENLPQKAFSSGNGVEAVKHWAAARGQYARFKRADAIGQAIYRAKMSKGRFADNLRSQFGSILKSPKKRRGFNQAELQAMEKFVGGGAADDMLAFLQSGGAFPATVAGHVMGGPIGGVVAGAAKTIGGLAAGGARNAGARRVAEQLRAQVALPGGLPQLPPPMTGPVIDGVARRVGAVTAVPMSNTTPLPPILARMYGGR